MPDRAAGPERLRHLPGPPIAPWRRTVRYWASRLVAAALARAWLRLRVEGRANLPAGPAVLCFTHHSWMDPFILMATLPMRPRLFFFGPREDDMTAGGRNRLISWTASAVPYRPGKNDLLEGARAVRAVFAFGGVLAIAGEGRIHHRESSVLPLNEGAAYFALRAGVPLVPVAVCGTTWIRFGGRVTIRIGRPIEARGRASREAVEALTRRTWESLSALVADCPEIRPPGRLDRWLTERFNEWPEGGRPSGPG